MKCMQYRGRNKSVGGWCVVVGVCVGGGGGGGASEAEKAEGRLGYIN